jgi:benzylsuccinate CoA-transferase BbsF subunit
MLEVMVEGENMNLENNVFSGLTIAGFIWAMVGPLTLKFFADYGATVIRVETARRPCISRTSPPFKDGKPGLNRSGYFNHFSANMYSMALNMKNPLGIEVAKKLIAKSDVVMDNFTPGVMEKWGLGYDNLKKMKKDIIMVRQNGFGTGGSYENLGAFGMTLAAISGIPNFIGWPDRDPLPVGVGAYTDCISPRYAAAALIAALDYRDKTGKGQLIELAQFETAISFILPAILDHVANGREPTRMGNANPDAVPHGVYTCKGEDKWCTIAVLDDEQWIRLCKVVGKPEWIEDQRFDTFMKRKSHEEELNALLSDWTKKFSATEIMEKMQSAGVPSGVVKNAAEVYEDPQLRTRDLFWSMTHSEVGSFTHLGASFRLSKTAGKPYRPSPGIGEHTEYICTNILGLTDEEFIELLQEGIFE